MGSVGQVEQCLHRDYARLVRAVAPAAPTDADAEDAVQEAFARAWEQEAKGQSFERLDAWIVTTALNQLRSRWRHLGVRRRKQPLLVEADVPPMADELLDLRHAVHALPARQQEAVVLHYLLGFDITTTADHLGVAEGTVKSALHRARASLHAAMTVGDDDE
ncbi:MAG: RNA polymerase sigma factor [Acidimicrobiales bacterium]